MGEAKKNQDKHYHWLVTGEITFNMRQDDGTVEQNVVKQNCIVFSKLNQWRVQEMAHAQQTLQMQLFNKIGHESGGDKTLLEKIVVTNVVIMGFFPCGHMTQEEFNATPEGMKIQPKQTNELDKILGTA